MKKNEIGGACSAYGGNERHIRVLVRRPERERERERHLGKGRRRWEDYIKVDHQEV
jgi:hypothetical protein